MFNVYLLRRFVAFCSGTDNEIEELRDNVFRVCKAWRNQFRLHLWVHPERAYVKALTANNKRLANSIWDYSIEHLRLRTDIQSLFQGCLQIRG